MSKRFDQDISAVCGAFRLRLDGAIVAGIDVAYGGMAEVPKRARHCEASLRGQAWSADAVDLGMSALDQDFAPISDMRASDTYRSSVCRNLLKRFYIETTADHVDRVYTYGR